MLPWGDWYGKDNDKGEIMRKITFAGLVFFLLCFLIGNSFSFDPPHTDTATPAVSCSKCHGLHATYGASLTHSANASLCQSCHVAAHPLAGSLPMESSQMVTTAGNSGRSHRWDRSIGTGVAPLSLQAGTPGAANPFGLRVASEIQNAELKLMLQKFNNEVVCSVCHDQHGHAQAAWDPFSSAVYTAGVTTGRHLMRMANDANQLCEDCHYYRAMSYSRARGDDVTYPANGTNVFSHPVGTTLNSLGYDRTAPLDFNGQPQQTAPRYFNNSAGDTNRTNNLALDSSSKVRCLTCHRMHYVDSSGSTVDAP